MKKYRVKVDKLVRIWMREYYEVEAENPDEAEKQVSFGFGKLYDTEFFIGAEVLVPKDENGGKPTVEYIVEEAD